MKTWYALWIAVSLFCLGMGIKNFFDEKAIFAKYEPATATVTNWVPDPNYNTADMCAVYEYTTKEGDTRSYTGENCVSVPDPSTVGKLQEQIYYNPTNPYSPVETRGWFGSEGSGLLLGFAGFAFFSLFWMSPLFHSFFRKQAAPSKPSR
jgi:hypothetical protein